MHPAAYIRRLEIMCGRPSVISVIPVETQVLVCNMYSANSTVAAAEEYQRLNALEHILVVHTHPSHHGDIVESVKTSAYLRRLHSSSATCKCHGLTRILWQHLVVHSDYQRHHCTVLAFDGILKSLATFQHFYVKLQLSHSLAVDELHVISNLKQSCSRADFINSFRLIHSAYKARIYII